MQISTLLVEDKIVLKYLFYMLTVHDISKTNLDKLDSLSHRYLKSWAGLPWSTTSNILHIPCSWTLIVLLYPIFISDLMWPLTSPHTSKQIPIYRQLWIVSLRWKINGWDMYNVQSFSKFMEYCISLMACMKQLISEWLLEGTSFVTHSTYASPWFPPFQPLTNHNDPLSCSRI